MASRIIAQLLLSGGAMVLRAAAQAYQQALINGQKAGGAEALKRTAGRAQLTLEEARQILGVETGAAWDVIEKKYHHLYKANTATSHYLLSKVYRAKERIDEEFPDESSEWKNTHGDSTVKAAAEAAAEKAAKDLAGKAAPGGATQQSKSESGS